MRRLLDLLSNKRGAGAVEFALVVPAFVFLLNGIAQLGILFFANAGLNNALALGARHATVFPQPTEAQVKTKISAEQWGLDPDKLTIAPFASGTANGSPFWTLSMSYNVNLNFILFDTNTTLTQSRRVYLYS